MAGVSHRQSVLFVCLGNICRSPLAEAAMNFILREAGKSDKWLVDSCGTADYHIGEPPDKRGLATMKKHGLMTSHLGRRLCREDFTKFNYIFGMDDENMRNIKRVEPKGSTAKIALLGSYDPEGQLVIDDPYYDGDDKFEKVYQQCMRCCKQFYQKTTNV